MASCRHWVLSSGSRIAATAAVAVAKRTESVGQFAVSDRGEGPSAIPRNSD